jgi:WD40 repeat protein
MRARTLRVIVLILIAVAAEVTGLAQQTSPIRTDRYGDPLPAGALIRLGTIRFRMGGLVYACAYSPDGKTLAACSVDGGTIHLFDSTTGKLIRRLSGNPNDMLSLAYSPDGKTLAAGSTDNIITLWETSTGNKLGDIGSPIGECPVRSLAFTPDGRGLISAGGNTVVHLWDTATGKELGSFTGHPFKVRSMALSPDGRTIASASGDEIRLWETDTGKVIRRLTGVDAPIRALLFSPDGKLLASGNDDSSAWLWETSTGKVRRQLPEEHQKNPPRGFGGVCSLAFSPDGKILATGSRDHMLRCWVVATGKMLREIPGIRYISRAIYHEGGIPCVAFSPDGRRLAFGQDNRMELLDVSSGEPVLPLAAHGGAVRRVFFDRDGKRLYTISDDAIRRILEWDSSSGRLIREVPGKPWSADQATLSPDRKVLAATQLGFGLHLTDTISGKKIRDIPVPNSPIGGIPYAVAYSLDGKLLAMSGNMGQTVWLLDAATGKIIYIVEGAGRRHHDAMYLTFSSDGRLLALVGNDLIHLAEVPSGRQHLVIHLSDLRSLNAFTLSPDGRTVAAAYLDPSSGSPFDKITIWEIASGEARLSFSATRSRLNTLAFSPDGRLLAAAGRDHAIHFWDAAGNPVRRLEGHQGDVESLTFSPDGQRLASASRDTSVLIWNVPRLPAEQPRSAALSRKELDALWLDLAASYAIRAYGAVLRLQAVPEQAVPLLAEHLHPQSVPDSRRVGRLLAQLDSETFAERERATEELRKLGWSAESALREALEGKNSLEKRKRIEDLLAGIRVTKLPTDLLRMLRGVEVLERINSTAARQLLRKLADDSLPEGLGRDELRREAQAALQRLAPAKP